MMNWWSQRLGTKPFECGMSSQGHVSWLSEDTRKVFIFSCFILLSFFAILFLINVILSWHYQLLMMFAQKLTSDEDKEQSGNNSKYSLEIIVNFVPIMSMQCYLISILLIGIYFLESVTDWRSWCKVISLARFLWYSVEMITHKQN